MVLLAEKRRLLWFGPGEMPANVSAAVEGGWDIATCAHSGAVTRQLDQAEIVLIAPPDEGQFGARQLSELLDRVDQTGAVAVVLAPEGPAGENLLARRRGQFIVVDADANPSEISARIESAAALQPVIRHLRSDLAAVRGFGERVAGNIEELDEEMRLAARLQREFLPSPLPAVGPVRFATMFRPVGWVSGDIYDVFRLDETHIGFYVADVVGHGLPAALLTMFVKKSLQTKHISANRYEIIPPHEALERLNDDIYRQNLSSCPFCTAVYGIIDTETLLLRYACGGHPSPLLFDTASAVERLKAAGPLMGVFGNETFDEREIRLNRGHRLVIFSDGAEDMLHSGLSVSGESPLVSALQNLRHLPAEEMVLQLSAHIDEHRSPDRREDDVTVLVMDIVD